MNAYWAKYGCDKCNSYKLLVLDVSITDSDTKQATQQYITQHGTKCPCVCAAEGGTTFCSALKEVFGGFPIGAGVTYLIKTDKTVKERPTATEINNAGGNAQHVCPTGIKTALHHHEAADITIGSLITGKLNIAVRNADTYIIAIHSADGRLVSSVRTRLEQGAHTIVLQNGCVASGVIVVSVKSIKCTVTQKVIFTF